MSDRYKSLNLLSQASKFQMCSIGSRLKILRQRRGWSVNRLSEVSGISISTIKQIELGSPSVSFGFIVLFLQTYGLITELGNLINLKELYGSSELPKLTELSFDNEPKQ